MKVVSNTTALINFARIGRLDILREIFKEILIPEEVYAEIKGYTRERINEQRNWIKRCIITCHKTFSYLIKQGLHSGEAAAIVLVLDQLPSNKPIYLILDETYGRKVAKSIFEDRDVKLISSVQVLKIAESKGIIQNRGTLLRQFYQEGYEPSKLDRYELY
ncbi:hypothetical protein MTHERMOG20_23170 [Moorella thermoacetica]|uniref:DUF3368 domain-containing protein n=1 Tax=Moorella thermoacetica (strain ATCC 39073 / JCM 9320) TaxID=264732 RepID=Q2RLN6_MOOTA|nr:hypothetical protein [Moorella thermoacetica]AKX95706.1 hypothetical protein MOTHA_c03370 [Moorella thermoacetica]OIQ54540.1 hypothetical protein MOCA_22090 [Moorella thermoacetica]QCZ99516.1 hypothetical protein MothHH_00346 [Moorella thermoacetica]TYL07175.1 hypothetical protein MOOCA_22830 [Moorella thermoacetica]TYL07542.1 hypothetical protein MOLA_22030 [Moorella thermoacetica]